MFILMTILSHEGRLKNIPLSNLDKKGKITEKYPLKMPILTVD